MPRREEQRRHLREGQGAAHLDRGLVLRLQAPAVRAGEMKDYFAGAWGLGFLGRFGRATSNLSIRCQSLEESVRSPSKASTAWESSRLSSCNATVVPMMRSRGFETATYRFVDRPSRPIDVAATSGELAAAAVAGQRFSRSKLPVSVNEQSGSVV